MDPGGLRGEAVPDTASTASGLTALAPEALQQGAGQPLQGLRVQMLHNFLQDGQVAPVQAAPAACMQPMLVSASTAESSSA